jgi:type IV secretion system protein VirB4
MLILPTDAGTPYLFTVHEDRHDEAAGHFVVVGGTGGGKTTGITLAATGALRYPNCKVFAFDADRGMLVWTMFCGGRYIGLQSDLPGTVSASLQPFQLELTDANRAHLRVFLRMLIGLENDPECERLIGKALDVAALLPLEQRRLDVIADAAFPRGSDVRARIERWVDPSQYGNVFCSRGDHVPIEGADLVTFDMTSLLKDPTLAPPIVFDAMHRIDAAVTAAKCGAMIVVDEAPFLLRNPAFRERLLERLRRDRKRRIAVGLMVQGAGDLDQISPDLGTDVRKLTATWIFLPNPKADENEYKQWDLTDREMLFIRRQLRGTQHMKFPALIKKKGLGESVFVDLDNGALGDMAAIYKSGEAYWRRALDHLSLGNSPEAALDAYLSECRR